MFRDYLSTISRVLKTIFSVIFLELLKHPRYLWYILLHKSYVYIEGRKLGLSRWRLICHDLSKFLPDEWFPYVEYLYSARGKLGLGIPSVKTAWFKSVDRHFRRNKHHWAHYYNPVTLLALPMPEIEVIEMVADWRAVSIMLGSSAKVWYIKEKWKNKIHLAPETRMLVESLLGVTDEDYPSTQRAQHTEMALKLLRQRTLEALNDSHKPDNQENRR